MKKYILSLIILVTILSSFSCAEAKSEYITESYTSFINISPKRELKYNTQLDLNFMGNAEKIPFSITGKSDTSTGKIDRKSVV